MDLKYAGDLVVQNGDIATVKDAVLLGQKVKDRLSTFKGEWFLDLEYGPDYRKDILIKNPRSQIISAILKKEILKSIPDAKFTAFTANLTPERELNVAYTLYTGAGAINGSVIL